MSNFDKEVEARRARILASQKKDAQENREDGEDNCQTPYVPQEVDREDGEDNYQTSLEEDPAAVLDRMRDFHKRFVYHANDSTHDVAVLWAVHTYAMDKFLRTPRLYVHSPEPGCGKTTQADLLEFMSYKAKNTTGITAAVLFRLIDRDKPTLIVDEADTVFTSRRVGAEDIKAVLNAGYAYDKTVWRCHPTTFEPEEFSAYAPVALIGIDNTAMPETIISRSIPIKMTRAKGGSNLEVWDVYDHEEFKEHLEEVLPLIAETIPSRAKPDLPKHLSNREAEIWRPLFVVANAVGGDWPERVRRASGDLHWENEVSETAKVLALTRDYFNESEADKVTASVLTEFINRAGTVETLSPKGLNAMLSTYGVRTTKSNGLSVYRRQDFIKAWDQWLDDEAMGLVDNLPILPEGEVTPLPDNLPNLPETYGDDEWQTAKEMGEAS